MSGHLEMNRRHLLRLGALGVAAPLFVPRVASAALAAAAARPLSIGYLEGSDEVRNLAQLTRTVLGVARRGAGEADWTAGEAKALGAARRFVAADELWAGDPKLAGHPLVIRLHGLFPPVATAERRRGQLPAAIDLDLVYPPVPPFFEPLRHFAWSLRRRPWNASPPVRVRFPLDWRSLPVFDLTVRWADGRQEFLSTHFTVDDEPGRPRVRRGLYALGFVEEAWRRPIAVESLGARVPAERFSLLFSFEDGRRRKGV